MADSLIVRKSHHCRAHLVEFPWTGTKRLLCDVQRSASCSAYGLHTGLAEAFEARCSRTRLDLQQ